MFRRTKNRDKGRDGQCVLLFCSDLHGSELTFKKLLRALEIWKVDALVMGGDVAGKTLVPVLASGDGSYRVSWLGEEQDVTGQELADVEADCRNMGYYPVKVDAEGYGQLAADDAHRAGIWDKVIAERWLEWLHALEQRCEELEIPAFVMAGNDDPWSLDAVYRDWEGTRVTPADGAVVALTDGWQLLSCGLANTTPWQCPRDVSESKLAEELATLQSAADPTRHSVANIHVPPFNTGLDLAPRLDTSVEPPKPVTGATDPVGSTAVREFLESAQPPVSLHGHVHESPGAAKLGKTLAINPGSEYGEGILRGVRVTLASNGSVKGHQFVTG